MGINNKLSIYNTKSENLCAHLLQSYFHMQLFHLGGIFEQTFCVALFVCVNINIKVFITFYR